MSNSPWVGQRLERLLAALQPTRVVGPAAAGADILLLEASAKLQIPAQIVLPFAPERFRESSVTDRGAGWGERFDRLMDALPADRLQWGSGHPDDDKVYERGNEAILDAGIDAGGEVTVAVVVRPKRGDRAPSVTDDFVARAQARGILVLELDPGLRRGEMKTAFVVMPYGVKADRDGNQINCESTFSKVVVPSLEGADLDWTRADRQIEAGIIHVGMLDRLARSDAVVVDTATENANAFYELGARHVLRPGTTVLIGPEGQRPAFNVNMLRRISYSITDSGVSDADAVDAITRLRPFLDEVRDGTAKPDSPLYQLFDVMPPLLADRGQITSPAVDLHRRIDLTIDPVLLTGIADDIDEADLPRIQRIELMLRVGVRLRESRAYAQAVQRLENLDVSREQSLLYGWWCQQLALAERRLGEQLLGQGKDPDEYWDRADRRLTQAIHLLGDDPETCGIAGGLAKRRALRVLRSDRTETGAIRAGAFLDQALAFYGRGFDKQPSDFYTGINLLTVGRIRTAQGEPPASRNLDAVAAVTGFYIGHGGGHEFWRAATAAELKLDEHLHTPQLISRRTVLHAYTQALAIPHPEDYVGPIRDQLDLVRLSGVNDDGVVDSVLALPEFVA